MATHPRTLVLALTVSSLAALAGPRVAAAEPEVEWGYRFAWSTNPEVKRNVCNLDGRGLLVTEALASGTCTTRLSIIMARGPNVAVLATDVTDLGKVRVSDTTFKVKIKLNYTQRDVTPENYPSFDAGWLYLRPGYGLAVTEDAKRATVFSTAPDSGGWLQGVALTGEHQVISGAWPQLAWMMGTAAGGTDGKPLTRIGLVR
ncbi:MAG: hypothetical protein R3B06_04195 [Kofleriaceae bacterium]